MRRFVWTEDGMEEDDCSTLEGSYVRAIDVAVIKGIVEHWMATGMPQFPRESDMSTKTLQKLAERLQW
jgi:hypothetical protein